MNQQESIPAHFLNAYDCIVMSKWFPFYVIEPSNYSLVLGGLYQSHFITRRPGSKVQISFNGGNMVTLYVPENDQ